MNILPPVDAVATSTAKQPSRELSTFAITITAAGNQQTVTVAARDARAARTIAMFFHGLPALRGESVQYDVQPA